MDTAYLQLDVFKYLIQFLLNSKQYPLKLPIPATARSEA